MLTSERHIHLRKHVPNVYEVLGTFGDIVVKLALSFEVLLREEIVK
jgi:hypothetical protein